MKKILFVFGFFLLTVGAPVHAELSEKFRDNFSEMVKDYCHSSISYSIEDTLGTWDEEWSEEGKAQEFYTTMGCIFDSALQTLTEQTKLEIESQKTFGSAGGKMFNIEVFEPSGSCQPHFLSLTQGTQEANEFESLCKSDTPEISQEYASCRVAETVLNEWCGYDLFLYAKMQDETSFYKQHSLLSRDMISDLFRAEQTRLAEERSRAQETVFDALQWYQDTESATRQSFWVTLLQQELQGIQAEWGKLRSALGTFVDKFLNASIPPEA